MPPPTPIDYAQIEYNVKRLKYLVYPALFVNLYYAVFLLCVHSYQFISRSETSLGIVKEFEKPGLFYPVTIQIILLVVLLTWGISILTLFRNPGVTLSFWMLLVSTILFVATICVPMYFWGGSHSSIFGPLLATVSGLTVIVAKKPLTRGLFGLVCLIAFTALSVKYQEIFPNKNYIMEGSSWTGVRLYLIFQTVAAVATIVMAIVLSWKHAQDRTIFGDDVAKMHVVTSKSTRQQQSEMLQTSIKVAVDIDKKILAGGGPVYSACVAALVKQGSKETDIWCVEWIPANQEINPESLFAWSQRLPAPDPAIEEQVKRIVSGYLAK